MSEPVQLYETPQYFPPPPRKAPATPCTCSVCGLAKGSLAILKPCAHPLCSACLTSALNIVGEKDMECAMCHMKVDDFSLCKASLDTGASMSSESKLQQIIEECSEIEEFDSGIGLLPSAFGGRNGDDLGLFDDDDGFMDRVQGASTPVREHHAPGRNNARPSERVVLRIDNVPWVCPIVNLYYYRLT